MAAASPPLLAAPFSFLLLASLLSSCSASSTSLYGPISISAEGYKAAAIVSPSGTYSCGLYPIGDNAFIFAVWFTDATESAVVWTANHYRPVNGHGSAISLQRDGNLVLTDTDGTSVWDAKTSSTGAYKAELLDTGNLVLKNRSDAVVWQSFASPTDTLLPMQPLTKNIKLVSGFYSLYFDNDNVLRLIYSGPKLSSIYWPSQDLTDLLNGRTPYNGSRVAVLNDKGQFLSSDGLTAWASDFSAGVNRRITLDYDGNLRMYSFDRANGKWVVSWEAFQKICKIHGLCGYNGICGEFTSVASCSCPPGYEMIDPDDWSKGCTPKFTTDCNANTTGLQQYKFVEIPHTDFYGFDHGYNTSISYNECKRQCLQSCLCIGFIYLAGSGGCYLKSQLFNGHTSPDFSGSASIKIPVHVDTTSSMAHQQPCNNGSWKTERGSLDMYKTATSSNTWSYFYIFASIFGSLELLFLLIGWYYVFYKQKIPMLEDNGYKIISSKFRRFTYRELKEATRNFKEEIGRGGSGIVYRGALDDTRVVAVKKLINTMQSEEEFWAEMNVIGRINHINLVKMWGFCSEKAHRLLVFEYVENESLDKHIFGNVSIHRILSWNQRFKIAIGTARGLNYLHHECLEWVIHCDVKPENILLTRGFDAKIADFGLAKVSKRESMNLNISQMRGTAGYMAPEWTLNTPLSAKVDVYSYGVVLLEIVTGSVIYEVVEDQRQESLMSFVHNLKQLLGHDDASLLSIVDIRLNGQFNAQQAKTVIKIAVSCLEVEQKRRPTMDEVVRVLEALKNWTADTSGRRRRSIRMQRKKRGSTPAAVWRVPDQSE